MLAALRVKVSVFVPQSVTEAWLYRLQPGAVKSVSRSVGRSASRPVGQSASRSVGQSASRPVGQSASRSVGQSASRSVGRSAGRSVGQSVSSLCWCCRNGFSCFRATCAGTMWPLSCRTTTTPPKEPVPVPSPERSHPPPPPLPPPEATRLSLVPTTLDSNTAAAESSEPGLGTSILLPRSCPCPCACPCPCPGPAYPVTCPVMASASAWLRPAVMMSSPVPMQWNEATEGIAVGTIA